jgi:hypothetical protein
MQPLAQFQVELVDHAGDGGRGARAQCFFHGPEGLGAVRGLDQDDAHGIEAERAQAMSGQPSMPALPIARHDEHQPLRPRQAREQRCNETESRGGGAFVRRHDFVQGAAGKTALKSALKTILQQA